VPDRVVVEPASMELLESIELLLFGAVGLTSVALSSATAADLTLQQWRALVVIARSDGIGVGDVAARVGTTLPSSSRLVSRLQRRGLVTIGRDDVDRRRSVLRPTEAGTAAYESVITRRRELLYSTLAGTLDMLPADLRGGLAALAKALSRYE
jgi:DNA-binding MarR family transcriptional regulator